VNADDLRAMQAPLKSRYKETPDAALITLKAEGDLDSQEIACSVETGKALVKAGLHPATGGDGSFACSGDMLLQALAACAGVTLKAVATALGIELKSGKVRCEGDLDFRGTLGVEKTAPVGFREIRLAFDIATDADKDAVAKLIQLTERYCVVFQTIKVSPAVSVQVNRA
jgi:uncharacterized OsmC-like protein